MAVQSPRPVILIGRQRSGTTWLSNMLSNHSQISSVRHNVHFGIVESNLLDQQFKSVFGSLGFEENRQAFLATLVKTNFFEILGEDQDFVYRLSEENYNRIFRLLMERYAERQAAPYWLQKAYSMNFKEFYSDFQDGFYFIIQRSLRGNLRSTLFRNRSSNKVSKWALTQSVLGYYTITRYENYISKKYNIPIIRYESLKEDPVAGLKEICRKLNLSYEPGMEEVRFRRNTSFKTSGEQTDFTWVDRGIISTARNMSKLIPLKVLQRLKKARVNLMPLKRRLIPGSFANLQKRV